MWLTWHAPKLMRSVNSSLNWYWDILNSNRYWSKIAYSFTRIRQMTDHYASLSRHSCTTVIILVMIILWVFSYYYCHFSYCCENYNYFNNYDCFYYYHHYYCYYSFAFYNCYFCRYDVELHTLTGPSIRANFGDCAHNGCCELYTTGLSHINSVRPRSPCAEDMWMYIGVYWSWTCATCKCLWAFVFVRK